MRQYYVYAYIAIKLSNKLCTYSWIWFPRRLYLQLGYFFLPRPWHHQGHSRPLWHPAQPIKERRHDPTLQRVYQNMFMFWLKVKLTGSSACHYSYAALKIEQLRHCLMLLRVQSFEVRRMTCTLASGSVLVSLQLFFSPRAVDTRPVIKR